MSAPAAFAASETAPRLPLSLPRLVLLLGLSLTLLVYLDTLWFQFVYDDLTLIVRNPQVHSWSFVLQFFHEHVWASVAQKGSYYRPVFQIWLLLNYTLFELHPAGWHLLNLVLYFGTSFLVYRLAMHLGADAMTAAVAAIVFGLHPVHAETVSWIADSDDVLMGLLFVGAFLCYGNARRRPQEKTGWWLASIALYALALLTKEPATMLPLLVFGNEWICGEGGGKRWARFRAAFLATAPFLLLIAGYALVRLAVLPALTAGKGLSFSEALLTAPAVACFYLGKLLWPVGLAAYYDLAPVTHLGWRAFALPALISLAALAALIRVSRRDRLAAMASLWLLVPAIPALASLPGLPRQELVHDRYLYLPSLGFAVLVALAFRWCVRNVPLLRSSLAAALALAAVAGLMGGVAVAQNIHWRDDVALFTRATAIAPHSVPAADQLANALYKRGDAEGALALYHRALDLDPRSWETCFSLGITEFELRRWADSEAHLQRAAELEPDNTAEYYYLAQARMNQGKWQAAAESLKRAIALSPQAAGLHYALGLAWSRQGRLAEAREQFREEIRLNPASTEARGQLQQVEALLAPKPSPPRLR